MKKILVNVFSAVLAVVLFGLSTSCVLAAGGNWNVDADGSWSVAGNWSPSAVPGTAAGDSVGLNFNLSAARIITLDTAATVGTLNIGDPTASFFGYILSGSSTLTFDNSGGGAQLVQATAGGAADTISTPITLNENFTVTNANGLTLSGIVGGSGGLIKRGAGTLTLSAANNYGGDTTLSAGQITAGNNSALGSGGVTVSGGTLTKSTSAITLPNSLTVTAGTTTIINPSTGGNFELSGAVTGTGAISNNWNGGGTSLFLSGDMSGFQGTIVFSNTSSGGNNLFFRATAANASQTTIICPGAVYGNTPTKAIAFGFATADAVLQIGALSGAGGTLCANFNAGVTEYFEIGALNTSTTFGGAFVNNGTGITGLRKVGTGTLTLLNRSLYTGPTFINNGILALATNQNGTISGPLGANGFITFGGGTLQYSSVNTNDYSARIANSTSSILIDVRGTNVAFASALPANNTGGLTLTNSIGAGKLILTAANLYTGPTVINAGTLTLSGSGTVANSSNITVGDGAIYDVSAVTATPHTLASGQSFAGSGVITGAVTTAATSGIYGGTDGVAGTLSFSNALTMTAGSTFNMDVNTITNSGNDLVKVAGALTLNSTAFNVRALNGASALQTTNYLLLSAGSIVGVPSSAVNWVGTQPANAANFTIVTNGNNVFLKYSTSASATVAVAVNPSSGVHGSSFTVTATVTKGTGTVTNVVVDLSAMGGSASASLVLSNTVGLVSVYTNTFVVPGAAPVGADSVVVRAKDTTPLTGIGSTAYTVNSSTLTWNGTGANDNWSTGLNWDAALPPGLVGDALVFAGAARPTPNMNNSYSVTGISFDGSASGFVIGSTNGGILTLTANGVVNGSASLQTVNVPVTLTASQIFDAGGSGLTFGKAITNGGNLITVQGGGITAISNTITGGGGLTMKGDLSLGGILLLLGTNTYAGDTTIVAGGGTIKVGNSQAIPNGSGKGNVVLNALTTLDLNDQNAFINGVSGSGVVDNSGAGTPTLTAGNGDVSSTLSSVIQNSSGTVTFSKVGTNVLTITSANNHSGGTTLNAGSIVFQNASAFGSGALTLADGNLVKNGGAMIVVNPVSVTGTVNFNSSGGGDPTFNGAFTGNGNLSIPNTALAGVALGNVSLKIEGNISGYTGTFSHTTTGVGGSGVGIRLRFGAGSLGSTVIDASQAKFATAGSTSLGNPIDIGDDTYGTFKMGELSGSGGRILAGWATSGNTTFEIGALNTSTTYAGCIQDNPRGSFGMSGVTKVGTGTLTLSGPCNYTGPTTVSSGTLIVSSVKTGAGAFTVADGATLGANSIAGASLKVSSLTEGNGCTNSFIGVSSTSTAVITNTGVLTLAGMVTVNIQGILSVGQYPLIASAGGISGSGGFVLGSLPSGTTATITTNGNTILLDVTTAPAAQVWTGTVSSNWDLTTTNWSLSGSQGLYNGSLNATFDDSSSRTNVNLLVNVSPVTVVVSNNLRNYTFTNSTGAKITGSSGVVKSGSGKLTLSGMSNDFTGPFVINAGAVVVSDSSNLGAGLIALNGTLTAVQSFNLDRTLAVGPGTGVGNGVIDVGSGIRLTNNTVMANYASGIGTLVKTGSGTLQLGAISTYTGGTVVSNGTLVLATGGGAGAVRGTLTINSGVTASLTAADALGYNNDNSRVTAVNLNGGILDNAIASNQGYRTAFNLTGGSLTSSGGGMYNFTTGQTVSSLANGTLSSVTAPILLRDTATLMFNVALGTVPGGIDLAVSGSITQQNNGSGILKTGAGTMVLTGVSSYNGVTTVSNGTLRVDGSGSLAGAVTVNGGTFGGTGTVNGAVMVNVGGTLSPGSSIGTLNINNNLTLAGNTLIELNKSLSPAQSNDVINVSGTLVYGGTLTLTNLGTALAVGNSFRVFPSGGTGSMTLIGDAGSGRSFNFADGLLSVVSTGVTPAHLTNSVTGNQLSLSWPAGESWTLQMQTNSLAVGLSTNWFTIIPGSASVSSTNILIDPAKPTVFYRLVNP